jgi:hypothetical protein
MRTAFVVLCAAVLAGPAAGQAPIRRIQPPAFPVSATLGGGFGFGGTRARDTTELTAGPGSGWTVGLDLRAPLGRTLGVEAAGQLWHPSQRFCAAGAQCQSPGNVWAVRGSVLLLWRFKAQAPIYFGLGGAVVRFSPAPVFNQKLTADGQEGTMEFGGAWVVGYDFLREERLGGSITWRSFLMIPSDEGLAGSYSATSFGWDNALLFGVRYNLAR